MVKVFGSCYDWQDIEMAGLISLGSLLNPSSEAIGLGCQLVRLYVRNSSKMTDPNELKG